MDSSIVPLDTIQFDDPVSGLIPLSEVKFDNQYTLGDTGRVLGTAAMGLLSMPVAGLTGLAVGSLAQLEGRDPFYEANKALEATSARGNLLTNERQRKAMEEAMVVMKPFQMAGEGLGGLTELASTGDMQKAADVIKGRSPGSNVAVPIAKVLGEASAMFGAGGVKGLVEGGIVKLRDIKFDKPGVVKLDEVKFDKTEGTPGHLERPQQETQTVSSQPSLPVGSKISIPDGQSQGSLLDLAKKVIGNEKGQLKMVERAINKRSNAPEERRVFEVSVQPRIVAKFADQPTQRIIKNLTEAREVNANPERVADWAEIYEKAKGDKPLVKWSDVKKINPDKLEGVPIVSLTKGCQRTKTTVERVENGILPNETRVESCFGGDCWVNDQFNRIFGTFENMEVRDLKIADKDQIGRWLADPKAKEWLDSGPFIRMGQQGCDSHTIASGLAEEWLKQVEASGIKKKTVMISASYAPVTKAQYQALAPYKDFLEVHFSNSGWFHKNEIMTRLAEFQAAKDAGVPAKIRLITNKDGVSGIEMPNQKFIDEQLKKMGVTQDEILETPFHNDKLPKTERYSEPTGNYKNICCLSRKCLTCGVKCMTKTSPNASVATSASLKDSLLKPFANQRGAVGIDINKQPPIEGKGAPTPQQLEVEVKGGLPAGIAPKYAEGSAINLEKLNVTDDVKNFLNQRTIELEKSIGKTTQTWAETRAQAEALGWNVADVRKAWKAKGSFTTAEMEASRQLNVNAVDNFFKKIHDLPADRSGFTPELRAELLDAQDLIRTTSQASSEIGRALNAHKRVLSNDPTFTDASAKNRIMKAISGKDAKRTDDIIDAMRNIDTSNPADVNRFIYNMTKTPWQKLSDGAYELWINGLLSHPLSHLVNISSNALTLAYTIPERAVAAGVEAVRAGATGTARQIYFKEGAQDVFSVAGGLQNGWTRFADAMKKGDVGKFDKPMSTLPEKIAKVMPTRALSAEDAFFKGFIEHAELNRLAYRQARNEGLKGQDLKDKVLDLATNPTAPMLEKVADRGKYLTYQKELGEMGQWVMRGRDVVPGLKFFIPFVKTPANIAKFALERTPLNFPVIVAKAARGELKGAQLSEELAKPLLGTALATTAYIMAEQGTLTGGQPKKKAEREEKANTGWQAYSRKIGDTYYSFGRSEPLGSILGLAADFNQLEKDMTKEEQYNVAAGIMGAIKNNIANKTFMQGFTQMIEGVSDPGRYGKNIAKSFAGSAVPAVVGGVTRSIDPYVRDAQSIIDAVKARIPVVAEGLPKKLTIWGEPVMRPGSAVGRFISPVQTSVEKGSPIEKEMVKLDLDIGLPSRKIKDVELPATQYWDMVRMSGQKAKAALDVIVQKPGWERIPTGIKEQIIRSVVDKFRNAERGRLEAQYIQEGKINPTDRIFKGGK